MYVCWVLYHTMVVFYLPEEFRRYNISAEPMGSFEATHDRIRESCWKKNETGFFFLLSSSFF